MNTLDISKSTIAFGTSLVLTTVAFASLVIAAEEDTPEATTTAVEATATPTAEATGEAETTATPTPTATATATPEETAVESETEMNADSSTYFTVTGYNSVELSDYIAVTGTGAKGMTVVISSAEFGTLCTANIGSNGTYSCPIYSNVYGTSLTITATTYNGEVQTRTALFSRVETTPQPTAQASTSDTGEATSTPEATATSMPTATQLPASVSTVNSYTGTVTQTFSSNTITTVAVQSDIPCGDTDPCYTAVSTAEATRDTAPAVTTTVPKSLYQKSVAATTYIPTTGVRVNVINIYAADSIVDGMDATDSGYMEVVRLIETGLFTSKKN